MNILEKVSLVEVSHVDLAVKQSIDLIGGMRFDPGKLVVIKPNICNAKNTDGMILSDFRIIKSVVNLLQNNNNEIVIVESNNISGTAESRVKKSGLMRLLDNWNVDFLNLSNDDYIEYNISGQTVRIPCTVLKAEYFINIPKIKTCAHTLVTLGIKNLFGVLQRKKKKKLHKYLNEILPFLAEKIKNDLIIVDGINCMEGNGPVIGNPICLNLLIAGRNVVAIDATCSRIMGYDPIKIPHIALSAERGVGPLTVDSIKVVGENWLNHVQNFEPPYSLKATLRSIRAVKDVYLS
jgi:uncharacterized protein (DUF362 family)